MASLERLKWRPQITNFHRASSPGTPKCHQMEPSTATIKAQSSLETRNLTCNSLRNLVFIEILLKEFRCSRLRLNWVLLMQFQSGINSASFQHQGLKPLTKNQDIYLNKRSFPTGIIRSVSSPHRERVALKWGDLPRSIQDWAEFCYSPTNTLKLCCLPAFPFPAESKW